MDGGFDGGGDDGRGLYQMIGTVTQWDGTSGCIITNSGERVAIHRFLLRVLGLQQPLKIGDQVHFWASKRVRISYELREIGGVVPEEPNPSALKRLRDLNRSLERQRNGDDELDLPVEELTGVVESFDPEKGHGFIRCEDGKLIMLHITCLRANGYRSAEPGSSVRFEAIERSKGWLAFRILTLEQPPGQSH